MLTEKPEYEVPLLPAKPGAGPRFGRLRRRCLEDHRKSADLRKLPFILLPGTILGSRFFLGTEGPGLVKPTGPRTIVVKYFSVGEAGPRAVLDRKLSPPCACVPPNCGCHRRCAPPAKSADSNMSDHRPTLSGAQAIGFRAKLRDFGGVAPFAGHRSRISSRLRREPNPAKPGSAPRVAVRDAQ